MIWMNWLVAIGLVGLLLLLAYRWFIQVQLNQLKGTLVSETKMRFQLVQQRETTKHTQVLIMWGILLCLLLGAITYSVFQLESNWKMLSSENTRMKEELTKMKTEQAYFSQDQALVAYPKKGLSLKKEDWGTLLKDKSNRKSIGALEQSLSKKLLPYFGRTVAILSVDSATQQVSVSFQSDEATDQIKQMKQTMDHLAKELSAVKEVGQVQFRLVKQESSQDEYIRIYVRESGGTSLIKQIDSDEQ